jgi:alkanesulfonate monooxygenase SsuD/methylene tetrahydromethanopterin reductase-like flavin-dependent oxidoreductase (luciferase family)
MTILAATCRPTVPPERLLDVARAAADAGLDELWLWEDCFWGGAAAATAAALASTSRLRVAVGVMPVPLRNVALTAMETAMLHRLFPGRVTIGVGHGVQSWMGQVGARPESPLTLLREYLAALRALLRGERVTVHGRYVHLDDVALGYPPDPAPPVLAAAAGPRTLRLSAELADGTVFDSTVTPEKLRAARAAIDAGRAAAGRADPHPLVVYLRTVTGPDAAERLAAKMRQEGSPPDSAAVAGDAPAIAAAVRFWAEAGATTVVLYPPSDEPDPAAFVRFAAEEVRPLVLGPGAASPVGERSDDGL